MQEIKLRDEQNGGINAQRTKNNSRRTSIKIEILVDMKKLRKGVRENKRNQLCNLILNPQYPPKDTPQVDHPWVSYDAGVTMCCTFHSESRILINC